MNQAMDPVPLDVEIESLRQQLHDAEQLRYAIINGEIDGFVVGPTEDSKRVLLLSGAYARYRQLVEDMAQGAVTVSRSGEILFANHAFAALLNVLPIDLVHVPLQRYVSAADRASLAGLLSPRAGQPDIKASILRGDGSEHQVRMSLVSANDDFITLLVTERSGDDDVAGDTLEEAIRSGSVDALVVGGKDVVMLDSAQRFYQAAVDRMQQGVIIMGATGDIAYANQRMTALLGMNREGLVGASLHKLVRNGDQAQLDLVLNARQGASAQAEVGLRRADGEFIATMITVTAIADGQKMCLVSDLSLQKRHEATDERTRKFLGMMAHEFRNILSPIRSSVDYLKRVDGLDPDSRKAVEVLDRQSTRLLALVEDLRRINPKD